MIDLEYDGGSSHGCVAAGPPLQLQLASSDSDPEDQEPNMHRQEQFATSSFHVEDEEPLEVSSSEATMTIVRQADTFLVVRVSIYYLLLLHLSSFFRSPVANVAHSFFFDDLKAQS
jgi:hypothetical protein